MPLKSRSNKGKRAFGEGSSNERYNPSLFVSEEAFDRYEASFKNRTVVLGRKVIFDDFETLGLREIFGFQGWIDLCMSDVRVYPELIRLFYANLKVKHLPDNHIEVFSLVKGQELLVTENTLFAVCDIPDEGPRVFEKKSVPVCDVFDRNATIRLITGLNELPPLFKVKASHLTPLARIVHHIIGSILLPKGGHRDEISHMEILLLDRLLNRRKINLGYMILKNMVDISRSNSTNLFYGIVIQKVLDTFKVDTQGEAYVSLKPKDAYSEETVKRMNLFQRADGTWVINRRGVQQGEEEEQEEFNVQDNPNLGQEEPGVETDSLHSLRMDFNEFQVSVNHNFSRVFDQQEEMLRILRAMHPRPPPED